MNYHKLAPLPWAPFLWVALTGTPLPWVVLPWAPLSWVALPGAPLPWVVLPRAPLSWVAVFELMWTKKIWKKTTCNNIFSKQTAKNCIRHEYHKS